MTAARRAARGRRRPRALVLGHAVGLAVAVLVAITGCGGASAPTADSGASVAQQSQAGNQNGNQQNGNQQNGNQQNGNEPDIGVNPPGPPGPTVPETLQQPVVRFFDLLAARECSRLVDETTQVLSSDDPGDGSHDVARLYRAGAYACLGQLDLATHDLQRVDLSQTQWQDCSGQPELLQAWVQTYIAARRGSSRAQALLQEFPQPHQCADNGQQQPTDTAPTDTMPTDTQPTDTQPTDTQPTDTVPTDALPTDSSGMS